MKLYHSTNSAWCNIAINLGIIILHIVHCLIAIIPYCYTSYHVIIGIDIAKIILLKNQCHH